MVANQISQIKVNKGLYILKINDKYYPIDEYYYQCILPYEKKVFEVNDMLELIAFSTASSILKKLYKQLFNHNLSTYEFKAKLLIKGIDENHTKLIINRLKEEKLLNDEDFVNKYLEIYQQKKGKKALKNFLVQKKINSKLIDIALSKFEEDTDLALAYANKYLKNKVYSNVVLKQKLKAMLMNKGFETKTINFVLENIEFDNELINLKKDIYKYANKYKNDYYKIVSKLVLIGYNLSDIKQTLKKEGIKNEN